MANVAVAVRLLFLLLVSTAVTECQTQCGRVDCKCCTNGDCTLYGHCSSACKPEYPDCVVVSGTAIECGMSDCKCCATNRCDASSGVCSDGCKPGYHGGRCRNKCPENCITCIDHPEAGQDRPEFNQIGYCTQCKEGHYFTYELYQCQSTCLSNICLSCQSNGCSLCKEGFFITSIAGFNNCDTCPERCLSCESKSLCKTCVQGWYGISCEKTCSIGCEEGCSKDDGFCQCNDGFTGQLCDTCIIGRYGINCNETCLNFCLNNACERESGNCLACVGNHVMPKCDTCINGFYGSGCDMNCPSNCLNNTCKQTTGSCSSGCNGNFAGDKCDKCIPGKYGLACQNNCPENCNYSLCHKETGFCISCIIGKFGKGCVNDCPSNCLDNICHFISGKCEVSVDKFAGDKCEECIDGLYGKECSQTCPPNCGENICDQQTGNCKTGCLEGFSGDKCCLNHSFCEVCLSYEQCSSCIDGKHGQTCVDNCSMNCNSCNKHNGSCTVCKEGFQGLLCNTAIPQPNKKEEKSLAAPIAGTLCGLFVLSLVTAFVFWFYRRVYVIILNLCCLYES